MKNLGCSVLLLLISFSINLFPQTFEPSQVQGTWRGTWVNNTFGSSDSAFITISYDANANSLTMILDLNGNVFGGSDPDPATMTGTYDQNGFSVAGNSPTYGNMYFSGDASGNFTGRFPNVPNSIIDSTTMSGTYSETQINLTYIVYFDPITTYSPANGVINVAKDNPTDIQTGENTPYSFRLYQNYPNPFNPGTTIKYDLKSETLVIIKLFDSLGREVKTLLNENKSAGTHLINFDGTELSSGIYYYSIYTPEFYQVKKMALLK